MKISWLKYLKAISCKEEDLGRGIGKTIKYEIGLLRKRSIIN